jgi:transcriptional regulator with XRE-family HTH domain
MTGDELKSLRNGIGLIQSDMAREMGLSVRRYQDLEGGKKSIRSRHVNSAERLSLRFAVSKKNPMLALPKIRQEALDLVDMVRNYGPAPQISRKKGSYLLVRVELGAFGETVGRTILPDQFQSQKEAEAAAEEKAKLHRGAHGYNREHGYWWGRDLDSKVYRFIVEST